MHIMVIMLRKNYWHSTRAKIGLFHTVTCLLNIYFRPGFVACSVTHSCLTLCEPIDYSPPGSSVHEIFQSRILEWVAISSSRGSSRSGVEPASPAPPSLAGRSFTSDPPGKPRPCIDSNRNWKEPEHRALNSSQSSRQWMLEGKGKSQEATQKNRKRIST